MVVSLLQSDLESFACGDDVGVALAGVFENFVDLSVFVIGIMMEERDTFDTGFDAGLYRLFPTTMTPAGMIGQFLGRVLRIGDVEIRILRQSLNVPIAPIDAMLDVRAIGDHFFVLHDSIADASLRMVRLSNHAKRKSDLLLHGRRAWRRLERWERSNSGEECGFLHRRFSIHARGTARSYRLGS